MALNIAMLINLKKKFLKKMIGLRALSSTILKVKL